MPRSQAEVGMAAAVLSGKAQEAGMSREYAREVMRKMRGKKLKDLPRHTGRKGKRYYERVKEGN